MEHDGKQPGPNHSHAWRGTWNRPMHVDEDSMDVFTIARMTDHNVKGSDDDDYPEDDVPEDDLVEDKNQNPLAGKFKIWRRAYEQR